MNSDLHHLFHKPSHHQIGGTAFIVSKIAFEHFDDAITLGRWVAELEESLFSPEQLASIKTGSPERQALNRLLAGCLTVAQPPEIDQAQTQREWPIQLKPSDVDAMPLMMVAEAIAVVLEVNADFFFQTLPSLLATANRIRSTGSALLSSWSAPATSSTA